MRAMAALQIAPSDRATSPTTADRPTRLDAWRPPVIGEPHVVDGPAAAGPHAAAMVLRERLQQTFGNEARDVALRADDGRVGTAEAVTIDETVFVARWDDADAVLRVGHEVAHAIQQRRGRAAGETDAAAGRREAGRARADARGHRADRDRGARAADRSADRSPRRGHHGARRLAARDRSRRSGLPHAGDLGARSAPPRRRRRAAERQSPGRGAYPDRREGRRSGKAQGGGRGEQEEGRGQEGVRRVLRLAQEQDQGAHRRHQVRRQLHLRQPAQGGEGDLRGGQEARARRHRARAQGDRCADQGLRRDPERAGQDRACRIPAAPRSHPAPHRPSGAEGDPAGQFDRRWAEEGSHRADRLPREDDRFDPRPDPGPVQRGPHRDRHAGQRRVRRADEEARPGGGGGEDGTRSVRDRGLRGAARRRPRSAAVTRRADRRGSHAAAGAGPAGGRCRHRGGSAQ
ncbi:MAG: DUF4157 domain-containing protein [Deltaproteobacteria bacterium]|nr:MAG: DUF4157 domain-containing protein [Deltaproteobacteria bacterium]